jgi:hypothetical protein
MTTSPEIVPVRVAVYEGVPVIGYSTLVDGKSRPILMAYLESDVEVSRWFTLMHLAARPALLDDPRQALSVAAMFLPPQVWDDYFNCGLDKGCAYAIQITAKSQQQQHSKEGLRARLSLARDWKGTNEFERPRSHQAFVAKYSGLLHSQAAGLPQDVILVTRGNFSEYSGKDGVLPISFDMVRRGMLTLPLANGYCAPTSVVWPQGVPSTPTEAESLIGQLQGTNRRAYLAVRVKVLAVDASRVVTLGQFTYGSGDCRSEAQVTALTLYADEALTQKLHTFPTPRAVPKAASRTSAAPPAALQPDPRAVATVQPPAAPVAERQPSGKVVLLNDDTLRLFVMHHKANWRETLNMRTALLNRSRLEQTYYRRHYDDVWPAFDPWGPFLPSDRAGQASFSDAVVAEFTAWSEKRAADLPRKLVVRFWSDASGPVISPQIDMGYGELAANIEVPGQFEGSMMKRISGQLQALGIAPMSHVVPMAVYFSDGRNVVRDAAIVFPAPVGSYTMKVSAEQRRLAGTNQRTELELSVTQVRFVPAANGSEVLVLQVVPTHLRLLGDRYRSVIAEVAL